MKYENSRPGTESRTGFFYEIGADFASSSTRNSRQLMYLNCVRSVFIWEKAALQLVCSCSSGLEMNILPKKTAPGVWLKGCKYFAVRCGEGGVMLLRTICILILGIISFALFLALSEIGVPAGL
jgi:hypothetical protein